MDISKSKKKGSPKTPGGISKSLLTPCRRVGLSRNWRQSGPSPFISPLSNNNVNKIEVKTETRKRKGPPQVESEEEYKEIGHTPDGIGDIDESDKSISKQNCNQSTPSREVGLPKKKSKTLLAKLNSGNNSTNIEVNTLPNTTLYTDSCENTLINDNDIGNQNISQDQISTFTAIPCQVDKTKNTILKTNNNTGKSKNKNEEQKLNDGYKNNNERILNELTSSNKGEISIQKHPSDLTKKCVVVIQKNMLKMKHSDNGITKDEEQITKHDSVSQEVFDSDSDEVPLSSLKNTVSDNDEVPIELSFNDDFILKKKIKVIKLEDRNTTTEDTIQSKKKLNNPKNKVKPATKIASETLKQSKNSFDDDDDDDFEFSNKRTILIKKSYDKVVKPSKAKSTGSITQRDVEELRAKIENKKKLLLAETMTEDTKELRALIKKWQKGCQNALKELLDLMKIKIPDKQNMDYSELLEMLRIPPNLVGYDSENDAFNTPSDANIILSPN